MKKIEKYFDELTVIQLRRFMLFSACITTYFLNKFIGDFFYLKTTPFFVCFLFKILVLSIFFLIGKWLIVYSITKIIEIHLYFLCWVIGIDYPKIAKAFLLFRWISFYCHEDYFDFDIPTRNDAWEIIVRNCNFTNNEEKKEIEIKNKTKVKNITYILLNSTKT